MDRVETLKEDLNMNMGNQDRTALSERRSNLMDFVISWRLKNITIIHYHFVIILFIVFNSFCFQLSGLEENQMKQIWYSSFNKLQIADHLNNIIFIFIMLYTQNDSHLNF